MVYKVSPIAKEGIFQFALVSDPEGGVRTAYGPYSPAWIPGRQPDMIKKTILEDMLRAGVNAMQRHRSSYSNDSLDAAAEEPARIDVIRAEDGAIRVIIQENNS